MRLAKSTETHYILHAKAKSCTTYLVRSSTAAVLGMNVYAICSMYAAVQLRKMSLGLDLLSQIKIVHKNRKGCRMASSFPLLVPNQLIYQITAIHIFG